MDKIEFLVGDITSLDIEAIVCPAHRHLIRGCGVSAAVFDRASPALVLACSELSKCAIGEARITESFGLPAKYIVHTVTPQWSGGDFWGASTLDQLASCYQQVLALAANHNIRELAFPALGAGSNRMPHELAAKVGLNELSRRADYFERLVVCLYDQSTYRLWQHVWNDLRTNVSHAV
jgi:O-acetyl-ADP-ribose deacetylase (regulator of RNase III)